MNHSNQLLCDERITALYLSYSELINKNNHFNPHGIHGVGHTKRVVYLAATLSVLDNLNPLATKIVMLGAVYHDIGRTHDHLDYKHGERSVRRLKKLRCHMYNSLSEEDKQYLHYIISTHCIHDKDLYDCVSSYIPSDNLGTAIKLRAYLCDADNLDRVRLGDLDTNYLRTRYSKSNSVLKLAEVLLNLTSV